MLAQVQTNAPLHFTKPFILVTRVGNNDTSDAYHNPYQKYYECDTMRMVYNTATQGWFSKNETPIALLRIKPELDEFGVQKTDYFHNFTAALDEYRRGIRVEM